MTTIKEQQTDWIRYRQRMEQESRVLVVDGEANARSQLDELLFRGHIPARSVGTAKQAIELIGREHYSLMVVADVLPAVRGLEMAQDVRVTNPDVDVLISTWEPSIELLSQAFDLRLLDVLVKPFNDGKLVVDRTRRAVRRHVDRRMRGYVLNELRHALDDLDQEGRLRTVAALERRLAAFKSAIGSSERVLVVESDSEVRALSESMLLAGMSVETTEYLDEALDRVTQGDVLLLVVSTPLDGRQLAGLVETLREIDPHIELALVTQEPTVEQVLGALRMEVAACIPWPPTTSVPQITKGLHEILRSGRQARLVDNLFVELYRETTRALGEPEAARDQAFQIFRRLIGLESMAVAPMRAALADDALPPAVPSEALAQLDAALTDILDDLDGRAAVSVPTAEVPTGSDDRRTHARVADSQFVRFRSPGDASAVLACLGDLSEGGVFIRTPSLRAQGDLVEVDITAEYRDRRYLVCCEGEVAWIARDERASPMAPGFGVRFVDPPEDVVGLLASLVTERERAERGE